MRKKAIQSFRLRLHSGLRQSGELLRIWRFTARLKPCPFEGSELGRMMQWPSKGLCWAC
jgi:hypothetical protein